MCRLNSETGPGYQKLYGYTAAGLTNSIQWSPTDKVLIDGDSEYLRSVAWEGETKGKVSYTWSSFGRLSSLKLNDRFAVGYTYTKEGEAASILTPNATLNLSRTPDMGLLSGSAVGNIVTQQVYDLYGELTSLIAKIGSTNLASFTYGRDALGRITSISSPSGSRTFAYNAKGQLVSATENGTTQSYSYTSNGNRLTPNGQEIYDSQERLISDSNWIYTYGRNGQLLRKNHKINGASVQYVYDVAGNLLSVKTADGTLIEYKSDGLDRRISRRVNGRFTHGFLYQDQLRPIAQVDQNGLTVAIFAYGSRVNSPDLMYKDGVTYRFLHDHLGSIISVVNTSTNQVAQTLTYDVWGNVLSDSNPEFQPFGFAGGLYDSMTGLVRYGARDYDASVGRWLNKDPIKFEGGWNLYAYVNNDPINFIDPDGLDITVIYYGGGTGHIGISVNDDDSIGYYGNFESTLFGRFGAAYGSNGKGGLQPDRFLQRGSPTESLTIKTLPWQDRAALNYISKLRDSPAEYNAYTNNCSTVAGDILRSAGLNSPGRVTSIIPYIFFKQLPGMNP